MHQLDCLFHINDAWHISGVLRSNVIPRIGERVTLSAGRSGPTDRPGHEGWATVTITPLISFTVDDVEYLIPTNAEKTTETGVQVFSETPNLIQTSLRELVRGLLAEGWQVWSDRYVPVGQIHNADAVPDLALDPPPATPTRLAGGRRATS